MNWPLLLIAISAVMSLAIALQQSIHVHGAQFTFNMTRQLNEETRLLDLCINSDIKIPNCDTMTGKVNSSYGEAIR